MYVFSIFNSIGLKLLIGPYRGYLPLTNSIAYFLISVFSGSFLAKSSEKTMAYSFYSLEISDGASSCCKMISNEANME